MKKTITFLFFLLVCGIYQQALAFETNTEPIINSLIDSDANKKTDASFAPLDSFTFADNGTNLTITINGDAISSTYGFYIDIDNNSTTGYLGNSIQGADFTVLDGTFYNYTGVSQGWGWSGIAGLTVTDTPGTSRQFVFSRSSLGLSASGATINVIFLNTGASSEVLPASGMQAYTTTVAETATSDLTLMTLSDNGTNLEILIEGTGIAADYDAFIDIDNNTATGLSGSGADFYIDEYNLYSYSGTGGAWGWTVITGRTNTIVAGVSHKFTITRAALGLNAAGTIINVRFQNNGATTQSLPVSGLRSYTTTTASNLASLTLTDDVNLIMTVLCANIEATYDAFIDSDNNAATGYAVGGIGADFLIQNGAFYSNNGGGFSWTPIATGLTVVDETGSRKFLVDRTALSLTASGTMIKAMYQNTIAFTPTDILSAVSYTTTSAVNSTSWTGGSNVWDLAENWDNGIPSASSIVTIPETGADPEITSATDAKVGNITITKANGITINSGGSLIVSGTSTGNITYKVNVSDTNWHLISSPVSGEGYDNTWVSSNLIASGTITTTNRAIATYQNGTPDTTPVTGTGPWVYMQNGVGGTFGDGVGYSLKRTTMGDYSFTGTYPAATISPAISMSVNNWNLIGNPYPSYIDVAAFITANTVNIDGSFLSVYLWNGTTYTDINTGYIYPGQAFFVNSKVNGTASITSAMLSHQTGVTFYKNSKPSIDLNLTDGTSTKSTQINYLADKTTGLNPGADIGMFDGVDSDVRIYTHLISENKGIAFKRQALPDNDYENLIVPIGVKADAGKEITFSANILNLPSEINVYIEDKANNTFTRLDETNSNYKVTLSESLNGVGRFYLHTSSKSLSVDNLDFNTISIYKSDKSTLRITGLSQEKLNVKIFNILGKQVINTSFESNGVKEISLSKLASGVYIVQLATETSSLNKKIILE
jgi:hypothetical protein